MNTLPVKVMHRSMASIEATVRFSLFHVQVTEPCFTNPSQTPDMSSDTLTVRSGWLPAGSRTYTFRVTAAKGGRSDSATASVKVLAEPAPTGTIR